MSASVHTFTGLLRLVFLINSRSSLVTATSSTLAGEQASLIANVQDQFAEFPWKVYSDTPKPFQLETPVPDLGTNLKDPIFKPTFHGP